MGHRFLPTAPSFSLSPRCLIDELASSSVNTETVSVLIYVLYGGPLGAWAQPSSPNQKAQQGWKRGERDGERGQGSHFPNQYRTLRRLFNGFTESKSLTLLFESRETAKKGSFLTRLQLEQGSESRQAH